MALYTDQGVTLTADDFEKLLNVIQNAIRVMAGCCLQNYLSDGERFEELNSSISELSTTIKDIL